jgi:hypothetical protein
MFREFILGNNQTDLVTNSSTIGGEDPSFLLGANNILPGESSILFGTGTATSEYIAPSASIDAWRRFSQVLWPVRAWWLQVVLRRRQVPMGVIVLLEVLLVLI